MSKKVTHNDFIEMISHSDHPYIKENLTLCNQYTRAKDVCYIRNKYGLLKTTFDGLKYLNKTDISMAVDKTSYFIEELKERNPKLFESGVEIIGEYKSDRDKITLRNKQGVLFMATPSNLKKGQNVDIKSAVDKFEYKKHFKNGDRKLGFTKEWWCSLCNKKSSSTIYLIRCTDPDTGEDFIKVGLTCFLYKKRYNCKSKMPYDKQDIFVISNSSPELLWDVEYKIKNSFPNYQPLKPFNGSLTECFSLDYLDSISNILKEIK